jgi:ubiquinone/menaquinone biosynthesis C-methylase UbiE
MIDYEGHRVFNPRYLWALESQKRDRWQQPDRVLETLALPEGAAVADIGAGGGYFAERFSRWVGPAGRVYATDVQEPMLARLRQRVAERDLANVEVVAAAFDDPTLPDACCDLIFFSSVYKEIDGRVDYLRKLRPALRAGGRVAILEFRPRTFGAGPPRDVRLPPEQVVDELAEAGFALVESYDFLPREYFLVFAPANGARRHPGGVSDHRGSAANSARDRPGADAGSASGGISQCAGARQPLGACG